MRRMLIALGIAGGFTFAGCQEKPPTIDFTPYVAPIDSSYVLPEDQVPAADEHNVLIEDFTGASCTNCPAAHDLIEALEDAHHGRINAYGLYIFDYSQTEPPHGNKYDFRTKVATDIQFTVFKGLTGMPIGGVDRLPLGTLATAPLQLGSGVWTSTALAQLDIEDSMNLSITCKYDTTTREASIKTKVTYLYATTWMHNLSLVIVEDSMIDVQEDNRVPGYTDTAYHFNGVLRDIVNVIKSGAGDKIAPNATDKPRGFVYERTYKYKVDAAWNPKNCRIIGFITRDDGHGLSHVYQSEQVRVSR